MGDAPARRLDRTGFELEVDDRFDGTELDPRIWIPHYLPHWSSRSASAARYQIDAGLHLLIEAGQSPWNPEFDGSVRVSSVQTGLFAGPVGSPIGQHHFRDDLVVREAQPTLALYAPRYGLIEMQARALDDPANMVALWMIGLEDRPEHSAEICVFEIFGHDVRAREARIGMGLHPFGDPVIRDDFEKVLVPIDAREPHWYAALWTPGRVAFYVDEQLVRVVDQSPAYPMQLMLNVYEFGELSEVRASDTYPKRFVVHELRGWRQSRGPAKRSSAFEPHGPAWRPGL